MQMQEITTEKNGIHDDSEYHDLSERLRIINRAIIQLIMIKEEYEHRIEEYLKYRDKESM